jgi:hypothetical protein
MSLANQGLDKETIGLVEKWVLRSIDFPGATSPGLRTVCCSRMLRAGYAKAP